jgi:hypothetical protein
MISSKDILLVKFLAEATETGRIKWESTAEANQFVTALKGKYKIELTKLGPCYMKMVDKDDKELLALSSDDYGQVADLYELARRVAFSVDDAIDEIVKDLETNQ